MDQLDIEVIDRLKEKVFNWDALDQEALNIYTVLDIIVRDLERNERPSKFALDRARRLITKIKGE
jgi:hypothetical protein